MDGQEHTCNHRHLVGTAASVVTAAAAAATSRPVARRSRRSQYPADRASTQLPHHRHRTSRP
jgi:hypothetical protein